MTAIPPFLHDTHHRRSSPSRTRPPRRAQTTYIWQRPESRTFLRDFHASARAAALFRKKYFSKQTQIALWLYFLKQNRSGRPADLHGVRDR